MLRSRGSAFTLTPLSRCAPPLLASASSSSSPLAVQQRSLSFGQKNDDGVVLPAGSRLHAIHAKLRSNTDQGLVFHTGKALTLLTVFTNDIYVVRFSLIAASCLSMVFHFVFPDPRPMRMFYGLLFAVGHTVAVFFYWYERSDHWVISDPEDVSVYETHFRHKGFTKHHFLELRKMSRYVDYKVGDLINEQGGAMDFVCLILKGCIEYSKAVGPNDRPNFRTDAEFQRQLQGHGRMSIATQLEGCWTGEVYDRAWNADVPHFWMAQGQCTTSARVLQFDKVPMHNYFSKGHRQDNVESAALTAQVKELWATRRITAAANAVKVLALETKITELEEIIAKGRQQQQQQQS